MFQGQMSLPDTTSELSALDAAGSFKQTLGRLNKAVSMLTSTTEPHPSANGTRHRNGVGLLPRLFGSRNHA